jgi:toxin ParE1/3/4
MATYKLTNKAESEIESIYEYSILNFGLQVAQDYICGLHDCFELLAEHQSWGSDYSFIASGLQRYEYRSHAIYYQSNEEGILIVRVLGGKQDPAFHM